MIIRNRNKDRRKETKQKINHYFDLKLRRSIYETISQKVPWTRPGWFNVGRPVRPLTTVTVVGGRHDPWDLTLRRRGRKVVKLMPRSCSALEMSRTLFVDVDALPEKRRGSKRQNGDPLRSGKNYCRCFWYNYFICNRLLSWVKRLSVTVVGFESLPL